MKKIGVISDTHLDRITDDFKISVKRVFHDVDMIIHAGDMTCMEVYNYLSNWGIKAVRGNMDDYDIRASLPEKRVEEIEGKRIGIIHGRGSPYGIEDLILSEFDNVDIIIFGHSHLPLKTVKKNVTMFNPGSYKGTTKNPGTVGIMEIGNTIQFKHIEIK